MPFNYEIDSLSVVGEEELKKRLAERIELYASRIKEFRNPWNRMITPRENLP